MIRGRAADQRRRVPSWPSTAASAAPAGGVACMAVRRTANSLPCIAAGTSRIRSVCAHAVIGAETKPSAAIATIVTAALG